MIGPLRNVVLCAALFAAAFASSAAGAGRAADPEPPAAAKAPVISATGSCPSVEMITAAVTALIPHAGVDSLPRSAQIEVSDLGVSYRVAVVASAVPRVRVFRDDGRDCEQRARFAAVFIVLTLLPPELLVDVQPKPVPAPPPPPVLKPNEPPARRFRVEVGAVLNLAPAVFDAPQVVSSGAALRVARRTGRVAGVLGLGIEPRANFAIGGLTGREIRIPLDLDVRLQRQHGSRELAAEVGIVAAIFRAEGLDTTMPQAGTRLDLGARAAVLLRFGAPSTPAAPFVGVGGMLFPWPYAISTTPQGTLGSTPALWLGATLGISASL